MIKLPRKASKQLVQLHSESMAEVKQREISSGRPRTSLEGRVLAVWSATQRVSGGKHISDGALEFKSSATSILGCTVNNALQFLIASAQLTLSSKTWLMTVPGTESLLSYNNGGEREAYSMSACYGRAL